ncbi:hypothetical protein P691DRAFT_481124 [Macrolepiota fuliginosa MF-IS2]|uniref:Uncharacterized protein n=1 Tax=Macrolepiota fuliginosa MF-IS2 TaxID=1400762 RepID=A0A9P5X0E2_9AGAR|nr:hypothetical protein P691DRAFT_481124 [Macrolepiota fuliginosa MF-IS2]
MATSSRPNTPLPFPSKAAPRTVPDPHPGQARPTVFARIPTPHPFRVHPTAFAHVPTPLYITASRRPSSCPQAPDCKATILTKPTSLILPNGRVPFPNQQLGTSSSFWSSSPPALLSPHLISLPPKMHPYIPHVTPTQC